jgi:predicted RNA-binding protein with PIN domain
MVIIDGHNLLWSIQQTNKDLEPISSVQLCRVVGRYLKLTGETGEIVFDGIGPPDKSGFDEISSLEVFFTGRSTDADTVIETKIKADTSPRRLIVVSSDRRIRKAAHTRKAIPVRSEKFWDDVRRQLSRKATTAEPIEKQIGLSEGETEQWLKFFDIEEQ